MKLKSSPVAYMYWYSFFSMFALAIFSPARKVTSLVLPVLMFLSLVRTKAAPLPGLTCWKSTTV
ncbi:hypothetical protein D3C87_1953340 [compost metagenome]